MDAHYLLRHSAAMNAPTETTWVRRGARGVAALEAALVTPLIVFVLFAIIEAGFYASTHLATDDAVDHAARTGAIARDEPDADVRILSALGDRSGGIRGSVDRLVIYAAEFVDTPPPAACTTGPIQRHRDLGCSV